MDPPRQEAHGVLAPHGGEGRQAGKGQVHLRGHSLLPVVAQAEKVLGVQDRGVEQAEERMLRIGRGGHRTGRDLFSAREHDARHPSILRRDAFHVGAGADLRPEAAGGVGQRPREGAEPGFHVHGRSRAVASARGRLPEQVGRRARRPRARERSRDAAPADERAERLGLEPLRGEVRHRHRTPAQEPLRVLAAEAAEAEPQSRHRRELPRRGAVDVGRGHREEPREKGGDRGERAMESRVPLGVLRRGPGDVGGRSFGVAPQPHAASVGQGSEDARLGLDDLQAPRREAQLFRHGGTQRAGEMGDGGGAESPVELLGDGGAPDDVAPLEHERLEPALGQQGGRHQAVVPGPDDHHVAAHRAFPRFQSFRISSAASRPGAPMIPPPGWVAEPHI